jgi:hypothetical protein
MSDCGKANFSAVPHREDMTIDKESIDANAKILLDLQ